MALINELIDITKLAKELGNKAMDKESMEYIEKSAKLFKKAKAISASANKYTVVYPVLVSSRISDYKTALAITKQIELECARFIILAAGMKPIIGRSGNEINAQLNSIFTEESLKDFHFELSPATDEEFYSVENYLESIRNTVYKPKFKKVSSFVNSTEMIDENTALSDGESIDTSAEDEDNLDSGNKTKDDKWNTDDEPYLAKCLANTDIQEFGRKKCSIDIMHPKDDRGYEITDKAKKEELAKQLYESWELANKTSGKAGYVNDDLTKLVKEGPTIINLKFWVSGENTAIDIPIAVKAVLKYVDSSDCADLLKRSKTFSSRFLTIVRLISGELCFKEWLLQLDEAKKDVEREKEIGHVPWYRNLLSGKTRWKTKNVLDVFKLQNDFVRGKTKEDMPMCTIIFDSDEFENAAKMRISKVLNDRKIADNILNEYMLLAFGIVDNINEVLYLFFAGESEYRVIDINKVGTKNSTDNTNVKLLDMLNKSIGVITRH